MYKSKMYAHKKEDYFTNFYDSPYLVKLCGGNHPCFEVKMREIKEGEESIYWGWEDFKEKTYKFIQPSKIQTQICSPGWKTRTKEGEGKLVNLVIEEVKEIKNHQI